MQDIARVSLVLARKLDLPTIVDGHALHLLEQESNLIRGWKDVILTPNMHESEMLTTWFTPVAISSFHVQEKLLTQHRNLELA